MLAPALQQVGDAQHGVEAAKRAGARVLQVSGFPEVDYWRLRAFMDGYTQTLQRLALESERIRAPQRFAEAWPRAGAPPSWDNVVYGSRGLGYVDAMHQGLRPVPGATVPLICGAMYPCSNPELVAAVSASGGIGIVQPVSLR